MGLLSGSPLTPWLSESLVLLGVSVPFAQAADLPRHFTGVRVGAETVRRLTEAAGTAQVALETAAVDDLERALPPEPPGPPVQLLSVDGAMAPLVGGEWAEVKTLALGEVIATDDGPRTRSLSYFSRLAEAEVFGRLATIETHPRYKRFNTAGYPIGSGCVESANKLVVEARLKGAGMNWAWRNVSPLLALRTLLANRRWAEAWPALWRALCAAARLPRLRPFPRP